MRIRVKNWYEYQHRKDVKVMHWFRLNSDIATDPKLFSLPVEAKWLFVCLLSFCAKEKSDEIDFDAQYIKAICGIKDPLKSLESLKMGQMCSEVIVNRTDPNESGQVQDEQNRTEQDEQDTHTCTPDLVFEKYNASVHRLPKCRSMNDELRKKIRTRIKANSELSYWQEVFEKADRSDFLCGMTRGTFKANLRWLMENESNHNKVMDGNYDNVKRESEDDDRFVRARKRMEEKNEQPV